MKLFSLTTKKSNFKYFIERGIIILKFSVTQAIYINFNVFKIIVYFFFIEMSDPGYKHKQKGM